MKIVLSPSQIREWLMLLPKQNPTNWHYREVSYSGITEHLIECHVPQVSTSNYLNVISEALDIMFMVNEHNKLGNHSITFELCQTHSYSVTFDVVFYFETQE